MSPDNAESRADVNLPWIGCSLALFLVLFVRSMFSLSWPIDHDCAMYMAAGQLLLEGKIPYVDFIDLNPPMIFYLNVIPAYISQLSGLAADQSFTLFIWILAVLSWIACALLLRRIQDEDRRYIGPLLFGIASFNLLLAEWNEFGQRQHIVCIGLIPFLLLRWLRTKEDRPNGALSALIGAFLGIGLSMAPPYLLVPLATEISLQQKRFRIKTMLAPEIIGCLASCTAYALSIYLLPEAAKTAFFCRWLPLTVQGYAAYNADLDSFTTFPFILGCLPLFFYGTFLARKLKCSLTIPLMVFCIASYIAVLIQLKGWYNHYLPLFAGAILLTCVQNEIANARKNRSLLACIAGTITVISVCTLPSICLRESFHYSKDELETIKRETVPGDKVMVLSTSVADIYPALLLAQRQNGSRYLFYFPIEMLGYEERVAKTEAARKKALEGQKQILDEIRADMDSSKPALILIPLSIVSYFEKNGLIDRIRQEFTHLGQCIGRTNTFEVWKRNKE